ncbi:MULTISPECIES: hypothetical protein [unclassified Sphingobacterium]|uniref:hypothetical protein n=1 Tax=unclassified Sphingobacterium TaxID=2609468 RepID=UPI0020C522C1|nr:MULTISPECIES: hypothetical protein [unclassified Sphingobacterium]
MDKGKVIRILMCMLPIFILSCKQVRTNFCIRDFKKEFRRSVSEGKIDFQQMNCFPWDTLMILAPYHYSDQIKEETGLVIPGYLSSVNAEKAFLVFLERRNIQRIIPISQQDLDLGSYIRQKAFSASFLVMDRKDCSSIILEN